MYLFVYGTLKQGRSNSCYLEDSEFLGDYFTDNNYSLVVSGLPFLVKRKGKGVKGELYKINSDTLRAIDRLEGHPSFYKRELITVKSFEDGTEIEAYTYIHPDIFNSKGYPWDYQVKREY